MHSANKCEDHFIHYANTGIGFGELSICSVRSSCIEFVSVFGIRANFNREADDIYYAIDSTDRRYVKSCCGGLSVN